MTRKDLLEKIGEALQANVETKHISKTAAGHVLEALGSVATAELLGGGEVPLRLGAQRTRLRGGQRERRESLCPWRPGVPLSPPVDRVGG